MNFEKAGRENSEQSLEIAKDEALKRGISHMVVASTVGDTGLQMARMLEGIDIELVVVTHSTGHTGPGKQVLTQK